MKSLPLTGYIPINVKGFYDFICQTPYGDVALLVSGLASQYFCPIFAPPLLITPITTFLLRGSVKIIGSASPLLLKDFKDKIRSIDNNVSRIQYLALLVSLASCLIFYYVSLITSIGLGVYRGFIAISVPPEENSQKDTTRHKDKTSDSLTVKTML